MVTARKSSSSSLTKLIFGVCCFALILSFVIFALEKFHIIDFYQKPLQIVTNDSGVNPVNTVDYSPATDQEKSDPTTKPNDTIKESATSNNNPSSTTIGVVLSAAGQDNDGGPVVVRAILNNLTGGSCTLTLTKDTVVKTYSAVVTWQGTYYSCTGFDVPFADLSPGAWTLKLSVKQGQNNGESSQQITVKTAS